MRSPDPSRAAHPDPFRAARSAAPGLARFDPLRDARLPLLLWLVLGGVASVLRGQDRNWDLLNYHLYVPFAFLHGRLGTDLMPAGSQSAFPPLLDLPYYLSAVVLLPDWPRTVAFLAGLPFGTLGFLIHFLCARVSAGVPGLPAPARPGAALMAALFGMSGSTVWSQVGTTYGDIPVAVLVVGALLLVWRGVEDGRLARWAALGGAALGLAAGLKPTAILFAPGFGIALVVAARVGGAAWRDALLAFAAYCAGWGAAFGVTWGWWAYAVHARYGNPVYPLMNQVFGSPLAPASAGTDDRFFPRTLLQTLAYPFFWLRGRGFVVAETGVADPRFAMAYLAILVVAARAAWNRVTGARPAGRRIGFAPGAVLLLVFVPLAYATWQGMFSILRYALALEALTGAVLLLAAGVFGVARWRWFVAGFAALVLLVAAVSEKQNWGRLRAYGARVVEVSAPTLPDGAVVATTTKPIAFVLPFLRGRDPVFVGLVDVVPEWGQGREASRLLHSGRPVFVLLDPTGAEAAADPAAWGLRVDRDACAPITSNLRRDPLLLCPAAPSEQRGDQRRATDSPPG